jgi:hypothetical protein
MKFVDHIFREISCGFVDRLLATETFMRVRFRFDPRVLRVSVVNKLEENSPTRHGEHREVQNKLNLEIQNQLKLKVQPKLKL